MVTPVFIFGAAHSGTTILYRMLTHHPEATWFSQFSFRAGEVPGRRRIPLASALDLPLRKVARHSWKKEEGSFRRFLVPRPGEASTIWGHTLSDPPDVELLRRIMGEVATRSGTSHVINKLPDFHSHLATLHQAFPDGKFIHILRDGRALALSVRAKRQLEGPIGLDHAAEYWLRVIRDTDSVEALDLLTVRYEDLVDDVASVIRRALEHVGLPSDTFPFERLPGSLTNRNGRWLDPASEMEVERLNARLGSELRRFGYRVP